MTTTTTTTTIGSSGGMSATTTISSSSVIVVGAVVVVTSMMIMIMTMTTTTTTTSMGKGIEEASTLTATILSSLTSSILSSITTTTTTNKNNINPSVPSSSSFSSSSSSIIHMELRPTGSLIEERIYHYERRRRIVRKKKRRRRMTTATTTSSSSSSSSSDDEKTTTTTASSSTTTSSTSSSTTRRRQQRRRPISDITETSSTIEDDTDDHNTDDDDHNDDHDDDELLFRPPKDWFHPYSKGVYATLHPPSVLSSLLFNDEDDNGYDDVDDDDTDDDDDDYTNDDDDDIDIDIGTIRAAYEDFIKYRHLSRYERQYRIEMGYNLYPYWDGNYSTITATPSLYHDDDENNNNSIDKEGNNHHSNSNNIHHYGTTTSATTATENTNDNNSTTNRRQQQTKQQHRRHVLESLVGGKFDNYQGVPLSQGYGTHYVHLWVGSPTPQRQSVIVDTGSHFTGFPVKGCSGCGEKHHTDPHFDPTLSTSFKTLQCPHECLDMYHCDNNGGVVHPDATTTTTTASSNDKNNPTTTSILFQQYNKPKQQQSTSSSSSVSSITSSSSRCIIHQAYTEGSSWTAYQGQDIVYCGGGTDLIDAVDPSDVKYAIPFVFGCLQENTGLFVTQLADGIMGMSAHELTLPKQLYNAGKIEYNMFAMCFRKELGTSKRGVTAGSMTLGGVSSALDTSPMVYTKNVAPNGWFTVSVRAIYVARNGGNDFLLDSPESIKGIVKIELDQTKVNAGRGVIVDSGTTDTYINSSVRPAFAKLWKQVTGMEYTHGPVYLTQSQLKRLPTLLVQMHGTTYVDSTGSSSSSRGGGGGPDYGPPLYNTKTISPVLGQAGYLDKSHWTDLLLAIPATSYMEYSTRLKVYTSRLFFTETRGGVLGASAMQGHNVLFDWQHGRIGFARSSCEYDLIAGKNDDHESFTTSEGYGSDCILATDRPILTQNCYETVNVDICLGSDSPTNIDISGMEIWTLLVEAPGEPGSCEDAIREWSDAQDTVRQIEPSTTSCSNDGSCQVHRPCHVPCMEAIDYHQRKHEHRPTPNVAVTIPHGTTGTSTTDRPPSPLEETDVVSDEVGGCREWEWSACDHSCWQSKYSSTRVAYTHGQYCVETGRDVRKCHIDACGRSDPCVVPFLVHAILVLEGDPTVWTPLYQELFRKGFTDAVHALSYSPDDGGIVDVGATTESDRRRFFDDGDVNILTTRLWYGEMDEVVEEEEEENEGDNKSDDKDEEEGSATTNVSGHEEALGIQLILQVSIANPKAEALYGGGQGGRRHLLQEVGVLWTNLTQVFRSPTPSSMCSPLDLYPLAKDATAIANAILPHPEFAHYLVQNLTGFDDVRLISSWTIGTQVYDDRVNYFGPLASTPLFLIIRILHESFIVMILMWIALCLFKFARLFRVCLARIIKRWKNNDDDDDYKPISQDDEVGGDSGHCQHEAGTVELVVISPSTTATHMRTTAMKRRGLSTASSKDSTD